MKPTALKLLDSPAKKATHTALDTIIISPDLVKGWKNPPFQRPLKVNAKVQALAEQVKAEDGVLPGVLTLGIIDRETYLLDGQHRREAFLLSGCQEGFADVRKHFFDTMADMGAEFVNLNSQLVRLRPDDILRGLEGTIDGLKLLREQCPWVGYDMIRRGEKSPIVGMSQTLRCWFASAPDVPTSSACSAMEAAKRTNQDEGESIARFLKLAYGAWGRDAEHVRLWGALNLTLCMWLYRRLVVTQYSPKTVKLTAEAFRGCLMSLSADAQYLDYLLARQLSDKTRAPTYNRMKTIFASRIFAETGKKPMLPTPAWVHS